MLHYLRVRLRLTITQSHTHTMQQTRTHKAVTRRVEAKKLLSRPRQSEYSTCEKFDWGQHKTLNTSIWDSFSVPPLHNRFEFPTNRVDGEELSIVKRHKVRILCVHAYILYPPSIKSHREIQRSQTFKMAPLGIPTLTKENNAFIMFNVKFLKGSIKYHFNKDFILNDHKELLSP